MSPADKQAILDGISAEIDRVSADPKYTCTVDASQMPLRMDVFNRDSVDPTKWHADQITADASGWVEVRDMATGEAQLLCPTCRLAGKAALGL
jgi:hypothetical protein